MKNKDHALGKSICPARQATKLTPARAAKLHKVAYQRQQGLMVIMEDVHNPHNLSAIARSCDAFGIQNIAYRV